MADGNSDREQSTRAPLPRRRPMSLAPIAAIMNFEASRPLASNHGLGMAIAQLDLTNWPASGVDLPGELSSLCALSIVGLGTAPGIRIARSGPARERESRSGSSTKGSGGLLCYRAARLSALWRTKRPSLARIATYRLAPPKRPSTAS